MRRSIPLGTAFGLVALLCGALPSGGAEILLAEKGKTEYTIVHGADAAEAERLAWNIQVRVSECYDPAHPDREWDIYASLRFEGPTYPHGEKGAVDRVYVDRVVLVPAGE